MLSKLLTIASLLSPAYTFLSNEVRPGVFVQDIEIREVPYHERGASFSGVANYLQNLDSANLKPEYVEKKLFDYNNIQIHSKIYIGSERQMFDFIFDTGSSWCWVSSIACDNCKAK